MRLLRILLPLMRFPLRRLFWPRLFWPLVISIVLHAGLGALASLDKTSLPASRLEVHLPHPPETSMEQLLKNTYQNVAGNKTVSADQPLPGRAMKRMQTQQQRLAAHVFYPPEAVEQGLEGEVRLLLRLDAKGRLLEARVVGSSGYLLLDEAAISAAYATGTFPGGGAEMILPVDFRLSE